MDASATGFGGGRLHTCPSAENGSGVLRLLNPFKDWMQRTFGFEMFSRQVYGFADLPYWTRWQDVALIGAGAFLLCLLAAWIPARQSARRDPVKSLRFE